MDREGRTTRGLGAQGMQQFPEAIQTGIACAAIDDLDVLDEIVSAAVPALKHSSIQASKHLCLDPPRSILRLSLVPLKHFFTAM